MTKYAKWIVASAIVLGLGYFWLGADDQHVPEMEKKVLYWVAPMDPNYKSDTPGKSPMGMD
ncbi:MAG: efflux RND transporter periplasmic adaptor subunit, partial [Sphingomonadales bacterium]|nr:efflux RND transporter periplasmic adaptor subunit [Sphingomonadales bacterium]